MSAQKQVETELQVFREFATAIERPIISETITHCNPPAPDIVCEIIGEGMVGFELTEIVDFNFMARIDLMAKTRKALAQFWKEQLSEFQSQTFKTKYNNALLHFCFNDKAGFQKRSTVFRSVFEELLKLPDDFTGEALRHNQRFLPTLEYVRVARGQFVGPNIDVNSFGWLSDLTKETISNKLSKKYKCDYPIELLAYIDWGLLPPEEAWRESFADVAATIHKSNFKRLWVFDRNQHLVLAVHP